MRKYRVQCPSCGDVLVVARDVTVARSSYTFGCPDCGTVVCEPASRRVTELLVSHGAIVAMAEPAPPPPLTMDDLIAFHELLADDVWVRSLLDGTLASSSTAPVERVPHPEADQNG
jgi:predicted RNA-binding Zn-ribbon protein involved in translation (DUF1610 family)